jgi:hypothetical protein
MSACVPPEWSQCYYMWAVGLALCECCRSLPFLPHILCEHVRSVAEKQPAAMCIVAVILLLDFDIRPGHLLRLHAINLTAVALHNAPLYIPCLPKSAQRAMVPYRFANTTTACSHSHVCELYSQFSLVHICIVSGASCATCVRPACVTHGRCAWTCAGNPPCSTEVKQSSDRTCPSLFPCHVFGWSSPSTHHFGMPSPLKSRI